MFVGVLTGPLYDKGYFRYLACTGCFLVVLGIMMTSISTTYWQVLLSQGFCIGLGTGFLFVPSVAVIAGYFTMKRSFAVGLGSTGGSVGGIVYSVAFRSMVDTIGFGWATRILGFMTMVLLIGSISIMKPLQYPAGPRSLFLPSAFKQLSYTFTAVALMITFMGLYIPYFHIQGYAAEYIGLNKGLSYQLLTIMNIASIFGRTIPSIVADKLGPINIMIPSAFGTAVMGFSWIGMKSAPSTIVFAILYGFLSGTVVSLPPTTIASMGGKQSEVGTRLGMAFTFAAMGLLTGNPVAGTLIDIPNRKFRGAQVLCGGLVTAGMGLFVTAKLLMEKKVIEEGRVGGEDIDGVDERPEGEGEGEKKQDAQDSATISSITTPASERRQSLPKTLTIDPAAAKKTAAEALSAAVLQGIPNIFDEIANTATTNSISSPVTPKSGKRRACSDDDDDTDDLDSRPTKLRVLDQTLTSPASVAPVAPMFGRGSSNSSGGSSAVISPTKLTNNSPSSSLSTTATTLAAAANALTKPAISVPTSIFPGFDIDPILRDPEFEAQLEDDDETAEDTLRMFTHAEQQLFSPPLSDGDSEKEDSGSRNNEEFLREAAAEAWKLQLEEEIKAAA
ncbi:hypothetical protein TWF106_007090 [Orbilia oligospora]|nr:hypothetical protein TWF106_007090 [Orbilia oligospora]